VSRAGSDGASGAIYAASEGGSHSAASGFAGA